MEEAEETRACAYVQEEEERRNNMHNRTCSRSLHTLLWLWWCGASTIERRPTVAKVILHLKL